MPSAALLPTLLALAALTSAAQAAPPPEPFSFSHKDWVVQCDNTLTCRAAGYQAEGEASQPISLLLVRKPGPATPVEVHLQAYDDEEPQGPFSLQLGRVRVSVPTLERTRLPDAQAEAVLRALDSAKAGVLTGAGRRWTLSLAGLRAVLLKMDEAQGRLDTPGALARRGARPESSVPAGPVPPVVRAVLPVPTRPQDAALQPAILARIDRKAVADDCNASEPIDVEFARLDTHRLVVSVACAMGAYNFSRLLWLAEDRPPHAMSRVEDVDGEFDPKTGSVTQSMKGRGLGDCWSSTTWHFDGRGFVKTEETVDTLCRGFPGGAWNLPLFVSTVVTASPGPHAKK